MGETVKLLAYYVFTVKISSSMLWGTFGTKCKNNGNLCFHPLVHGDHSHLLSMWLWCGISGTECKACSFHMFCFVYQCGAKRLWPMARNYHQSKKLAGHGKKGREEGP